MNSVGIVSSSILAPCTIHPGEGRSRDVITCSLSRCQTRTQKSLYEVRRRRIGASCLSVDASSTITCHEGEVPVSQCPCCGRRATIAALTGALSASFDFRKFAHAASGRPDPKLLVDSIHSRPGWYEEFFALVLEKLMKSYELQMGDRKAQLFSYLGDKALTILELGIGTGPNLKYYAKGPDVSVIGVDPNQHMEKYARAAAINAGLQDSQFKFLRAVGEGLPVDDNSVDAVVCTLVLCSVKDVATTLQEVKRVLKPGGSFLFVEHVAAPEGSSLRFWQDFLNPVQEFVADGCHLNRNTLDDIQNAQFTSVNAQRINVPELSLISTHIIGMAQV